MCRRFQSWAILLSASLLPGCGSIQITAPANGSTVTGMPQPLTWSSSGVNTLSITLDGINVTGLSGGTVTFVPGVPMLTVAPGAHAVSVSGQGNNVFGSYNVSATSNFTVAPNACPLCYVCPTGQFLYAFTGLCCTGSRCDFVGYANFGLTMLNAPGCSGFQANDCINQNAGGLCGGSNTGFPCVGTAEAFAASFSPFQSGVLSQIQVPISSLPGPQANQFQAWITADNSGKPGTVLETFSLSNIRLSTFPTQTPVHIFSVAHPALAAGTTYWLVIGPAAPTANGSWNLSLADAPASGSSNFLFNDTGSVPSINGPWAPPPTSGAPLRTAFEIDVR